MQGAGEKPGSLVMSKILLAEDDIDMRRFLVKALQNAGRMRGSSFGTTVVCG